MTRSDDVREVIEIWPGSVRSLAKEAGVPHSTLVRIQQGVIGASPDVAERVRGVCERYSVALAEAARNLKGGDNE